MAATKSAQKPVFYLIYISKATELMAQHQLMCILEQSRRNNTANDITGMLIYMESRFINKLEGRFMQLLEGDESDVRMIYDRILVDERNDQILLLNTGYYESRSFPGWSMGFRAMNEGTHQNSPGFFELDDQFLLHDLLQRPLLPLGYLKSFYKINQVDMA
jgi:hypothetical protein